MTIPAATSQQLLHVLQRYWGYTSFRPLQEEAMLCAVGGRDSVVVLPTGGGKSLCFQAPALCLPGLAVVVSPLISLMKDQVDALRSCGVAAACVNSTLSHQERKRVADEIRGGRLKLLYVAPERLVQDRTLEFLQSQQVSLVAIDEAHCISEWGHDFRPEYRTLKILRQAFPGVGIHAYTATATPQVRGDIAHQLGLNHPKVLVGSFDRPNLVYRVERRSDRLRQIEEVLRRHKGESGIIYCISRKDVDETTRALRELGHRAVPYHAGLSDVERHRGQDEFLEEKADIVVATVAFGMGIDKSNVRFVLHAGMPKSLEAYQQESGRAGRDGLEAECVLLYSGGDYSRWKTMMADAPSAARPGAAKTLSAIYDYCTSVVCRHRALLAYFGQQYEKDSCQACDVCLGDLDLVEDALVVGQKILSCVVRLNQKFGAGYTALVLCGSADERIARFRHDKLSTYGLLRDHASNHVRLWIEQLVGQGHLEKVGEYNTLQVTPEGRRVLRGEVTPRLLKPKVKTKKQREQASRAGVAADAWEGVDAGLFDSLRQLRREKADAKTVPAYVVFSDATLRDMARRRPTSLAGFREVSGVGEQKLAEYGDEFVAHIAAYCREHGVETDVRVTTALPPETDGSLRAASVKAFELFRQQNSVDDVARRMQRARSTVLGYLGDYLRHEQVVDPTPWVDGVTIRRIEAAVEQVGAERLKPLFEHLGGTVGYDQIRIVLTCLKNNGHVDRPTNAEPTPAAPEHPTPTGLAPVEE